MSQSSSPSSLTEAVELTASASSLVSVVPRRGALVALWQARGKDRLYLDETTLADPNKNVRGGVPLLFPAPGKLAEGRYARAGKSGAMKQHGFARDLRWAPSSRTEDSVTLSLSSNDATLSVYPWPFELTLKVTLTEPALKLSLRVENTGKEPMPFGFGIHPYFAVKDKAGASIGTCATRAFDNVKGVEVPFSGFDLAHGETDLHLIDHGSTECTLKADGGSLTVRTSAEFTRWVVWTLPGKDFVCVEPWTSPGNALNTGDGLLTLAPGGSKELWIELEAG
jgi:galactose mutarotase-like enzyme